MWWGQQEKAFRSVTLVPAALPGWAHTLLQALPMGESEADPQLDLMRL